MLDVTTPQTGNREFRDEIVRLAELTVTSSMLDGLTFVNCTIIGPAVLLFLHDVTIQHCSWDAPGQEAIFWLVEPGRAFVVGAIAVQNCTFSACRFSQVGVAGDDGLRETLARAF